MSADNWARCPQCKNNADGLYGKVSEDEYKSAVGLSEETNLREDYEIYVQGGAVRVSYSCHCEACGLTHSFKHLSALPLAD